MNVKRGDLAQVIHAVGRYEWTLGRVVRIAERCCFSDLAGAWTFEEPLREGAVLVRCAPDRYLKRIDPLTDDEVKEEHAQAQRLAKKPRPKSKPVIPILVE